MPIPTRKRCTPPTTDYFNLMSIMKILSKWRVCVHIGLLRRTAYLQHWPPNCVVTLVQRTHLACHIPVQQLTMLKSLSQCWEISRLGSFGTIALHFDKVEVLISASEIVVCFRVVQDVKEALFPVVVLSSCWKIGLSVVLEVDVHPLRVVNAGSTM